MSEADDAWSDYLGSAHRLDVARREAATAVAAEAEAIATARAELPTLQSRLDSHAERLLGTALEKGISPPPLTPGQAEKEAGQNAVAGGPVAVLAALEQAGSTLDAADAILARMNERQAPQAIRNLVAYGPAGFVAMVVQLGFTLLVDERTKVFYAFACGLTMAAMFWGAAWLLLGVIYPRKEKTARFGAFVCAVPVLLVFLLYALT
jgi:hypothetical protein